MTNKEFKVFKETAVPSTWEADAVYFIQASGSTYMEIYTTSSTAVPKRLINESDITALIASGITASQELKIVSDIAARNALNPTTTIAAYVIDATADTTVASGGAYYLYNPTTSTWIKTSEAESLDIVLSWESIEGKPSSSPAQIDAAVANSHTHANKTQLDKVGEDANGNLIYDGHLPYTGWQTTNW
jgi:hypothetical protein